MTRLRSPIPYFGGKAALADRLISLFPEHKTYVEVFGGGGSILFTKEPSSLEVFNDLSGNVINFFRVVRDREGMFPDLYNRACLSPFSREEWRFCKDHLNDDPDPVERARRFFVLARYSFGGMLGAGFALTVSKPGGKARAFGSALCMLPAISERLREVEIEMKDFRDVIRLYDSQETFFYFDPPYLPETRRSGGYECEMTLADHKDLVSRLLNIKGKAMLSGYPSELYDSLGWRRVEWETTCAAAGRTKASGLQGTGAAKQKQKRTECVWMNY